MPTIYVLLCEKNRYYVGKTERSITKRIKEHFADNGSEWTRRYKPLKVIETIHHADDFDEDKYTKMYMKQYGINNVRGGSYAQINLPEYSLQALEKELCSASDLCFRCNRPGHFVSQCYASRKANGTHIEPDCSDDDLPHEKRKAKDAEASAGWYCENCYDEFTTKHDAFQHAQMCNKQGQCNLLEEEDEWESVCSFETENVCYRCEREGHSSTDCYAKTTKNGDQIQDIFCCSYCNKEFDTLKGATCHENLYCKKKTKSKKTCYRCGRKGHSSTNCYASSHVKGYMLDG